MGLTRPILYRSRPGGMEMVMVDRLIPLMELKRPTIYLINVQSWSKVTHNDFMILL